MICKCVPSATSVPLLVAVCIFVFTSMPFFFLADLYVFYCYYCRAGVRTCEYKLYVSMVSTSTFYCAFLSVIQYFSSFY